jgi:acid phosphatase type 7
VTSPRRRPPLSATTRLALGVAVAAIGALILLVGLARVGTFGSGTGRTASIGPVTTASIAPPATGSPERSSGTGSGGSATPAPSTSSDPVLVGAGDIGRCDSTNDDDTAALVASLVASQPALVFTLGDDAYNSGTDEEFRDCFGPSWGRFKDRIALPVPGNHEYGTENAQGYRNYFGPAAVRDGNTWYSQDIGSWHVVVLDATCDQVAGGCDPDSPQVQWLRADLAASEAKCTLALWHQPRFSSGSEHGDDPAVGPFWDALYAANADLVLNGHDHDYERFAPQAPDGSLDRARGITEIVVGTGGADQRPFGKIVPNGVVRSSVAYGVIVVTLHASGWSYRFVSTDGSFSDSGTGACH